MCGGYQKNKTAVDAYIMSIAAQSAICFNVLVERNVCLPMRHKTCLYDSVILHWIICENMGLIMWCYIYSQPGRWIEYG